MSCRAGIAAGVSGVVAALTLLAPATSAAVAPSPTPVLIEAYGDSTTLGITCTDGQTRCEANQVCVPSEGCEWQSCDSSNVDQLCVIDPNLCDARG